MKTLFFRYLLVIASIFAIACAPEVKHLPSPAPKPHLGPKHQDEVLSFKGNSSLYEKLPTVREQTFPTAEIFNTIENLNYLGDELQLTSMKKLAQQMESAFYTNSTNISTIRFEKSPFADIAYNEAAPLVDEKLEEVLKLLARQEQLLIELLDRRTIPAPSGARYPLRAFPHKIQEKLQAEINYLKANGIDPLITNAIEQVVDTEIASLLNRIRYPINDLLEAKTLSFTLSSLERIFIAFQYTPDKSIADQIVWGKKIALLIDALMTEQQALTLLIELWKSMTPQERQMQFKTASPELYDYLKERTSSDLECLASERCSDFILGFHKRELFSQLKAYGLKKLQTQLNQGAQKGLVEVIEKTLPTIIASLPQELKNQILPRMKQEVDAMIEIKENFEVFLRDLLFHWVQKAQITPKGSSLISYLEKNQVLLKLNDGKPTLYSTASNNTSVDFQTIGASLALKALHWHEEIYQNPTTKRNPIVLRSMLEQINKLLLTYSQRPQKDHPSSSMQFNALATAELLRGLSKISYHFRDYEPTMFDHQLGRVTLNELDVRSLPPEIGKEALFPKGAFFALTLGNAGLHLKALKFTPSPVFTVDLENRIQWLDQAKDNPASPNVMAGVVDIINGKRSKVVTSKSLSKFLSALTHFYRATETLDRTKAKHLWDLSPEGKPHVTVIMESRPQIKDLIIGLSNFLSHQIKNSEGATLHSINVYETLIKDSKELYLEDQIHAIQALLDSYELLNMDIYLWSAIDTYYALNRSLWNEKANFYYADSDKNPADFLQKIAILQVIVRLKPFLPPASQQQIEKILHFNTKAFQK